MGVGDELAVREPRIGIQKILDFKQPLFPLGDFENARAARIGSDNPGGVRHKVSTPTR
jgi:hypothetical protein